jgi:single-stranded DNA-binding protein
MEIIGRLTADAKVSETKAGKKVVNFPLLLMTLTKQKEAVR